MSASARTPLPGRQNPRWKRPLDLVLVALVIVPALVVGVGIGLAIWTKLGRPILFAQVRPGTGGRPFRLLKFRSMTALRENELAVETDAQRLTAIGRWLRSTSLDELPQLWNVLVGDMSIVGPRPLLMEYLPLYDHDQARRHTVRPGIIGWAQVNGRNAQTWEERFRLDVWYVDHASLWLDLKVLAMTVRQVLKRQGISQAGHPTMERFRGNG